jgi:UDP-N-acetylmuramoyl-tripeptide--D-alanyl-D-alanine ligase
MTLFAWNAARVSEALGLPEAKWDHGYSGISTDTRTLADGNLFVALKGERFDGHAYLGDARLADVGGVIVRHGTPSWPGFDWFEVDDTLVALGRLARYRRERFGGPVVAITGTNGKTSTKELTAAALSPKYRVHKSERNLNNLVGVPLTVLAAPMEAEAMVVECGASVPGELGRMREIVRPEVAVVTNVDAGHLEGFGSRDAVLSEKVSLLAEAATAVVGDRPPALAEQARRAARRVITTSAGGAADWAAEDVRLLPDGRPAFRVRGVAVELPLRGAHMVGNALVALAVADALGVPLADAAAALAQAVLPGGRMEVFEAGGMTVVNDCYNANPASLAAALDLVTGIRAGRRLVLVVGTMRELGPESAALHREAAERVLAAKPDAVVAIGDFVPAFEALGEASKPVAARGANPQAVAPALKELLRPGDVVLLKASRGVALEQLIPALWPTQSSPEVH